MFQVSLWIYEKSGCVLRFVWDIGQVYVVVHPIGCRALCTFPEDLFVFFCQINVVW